MEIRRINNGKIFCFGNDVIPKYSFNAKELDEETGMYYFEARYYRAPTFISRDPLMNEKPWLTPYHYCSNNPIGRIDPTGMMDEEPDNPHGKKTSNVNTKVEVKVVPQDNLKQKPIVLPIENGSSKPKESLFQRFKKFFSSYMTGGIYGTADNGQGQETRKGDGKLADLSPLVDNVPSPSADDSKPTNTTPPIVNEPQKVQNGYLFEYNLSPLSGAHNNRTMRWSKIKDSAKTHQDLINKGCYNISIEKSYQK